MHDFEGDLLIGGMKLSHLSGELEMESLDDLSHDWYFAGRIKLLPEDRDFLQLGRLYRLELADGRCGQVMISRLEPIDNEHIVAEFLPQNSKRPTEPLLMGGVGWWLSEVLVGEPGDGTRV